jgi:ribosome biogenesis protein Tsr3
MLWNRFPRIQKRLEQHYRRKLGYLIAASEIAAQNIPADA